MEPYLYYPSFNFLTNFLDIPNQIQKCHHVYFRSLPEENFPQGHKVSSKGLVTWGAN